MSTTSLDHDDLEPIPSIRMDEIQPRRNIDVGNDTCSSVEDCQNECVIDSDYDAEYVIKNEDEDSNIGSMVSIHSEEVVWDQSEMILPDMINECDTKQEEEPKKKIIPITNAPDRWPTLEILPGGIIKNGDKLEDTMYLDDDLSSSGIIKNSDNLVPSMYPSEDFMIPKAEMIYACAKCPQKFQYLFCLVEHVKTHEDAKKKMKPIPIAPAKPVTPKPISKQKSKCIYIKVKQRMRKVPKKSIAYV